MGDSNGILQVSAKDKGTNKENKITITNDQNRLTPEEIQKMVDDAEKFAEEDNLVKKTTEAKNGLESYAYSLKRQVEDKEQLGGKIPEEDKEKILKVIEEKLEWLKDNEESSAEEFDSQKKEIEEVASPIIVKLYESAASNESEEDMTSEEANDGDSEAVKVLDEKNFHQIVNNPDKKTMVMFYAPWCGHCKKLHPTWDKLAKKYKNSDDVIIAKIDSTENEIKGIKIKGFPTIKLFMQDVNKVKDYDGKRTVDGFVKFIEASDHDEL